MVGKLMKHELYALFRILLFFGVAVLVLSAVGSIIIATNEKSILGTLLCALAIYLAIMSFAAAYILSIARFSKTLFSGEGYMTFSLPVSPSQLLISKLLSAIVASFYGAVVAVLSVLIIFLGLGPEVTAEFSEIFREILDVLTPLLASDPLLVVEFVLLIIVDLPMTLLLFYTVLSVGQLFTKARKWAPAVIVVVFLFVISPMLSSYCVSPIMALLAKVSIHLAIWAYIIGSVAIEVACFFVVRYIFMHKVNLVI